MITRNKSRRGNVSNDENAIAQGKVVKKPLNTRSRAVLGGIENINLGELPEMVVSESDQHPKCHLNAAITNALRELRKTVLKLPLQMRTNFYRFYKQRMEVRNECLMQNPLYFVDLHDKLLIADRVVDCAVQASFDYYQDVEYLVYPLPPSFLSGCVDLTPRMRHILVDWMVQVHQGYKLTTETLFLALRLLDRYVYKSANQVSRQIFQLLGVTALHIASKFVEIFPPDISDYSSLTEGCFDASDIAVCEQMILKGMDFFINIPCPLFFLRRLSKSLGVDSLVHNLSKYFLELAFQEYELAHLSANFLSTVALCLALAVTNNTHIIDDVWDAKLAFLSGYRIDDVRESLQILARAVLRQSEPSKYRATYEKYRSDDLFQRVAAMPELESRTMHMLGGTFF
ncbi:G2/mitotic-specific cyclin-B2 [Taenia solium]|eukprot:TsM_000465100 transcript=TsM_000465100 gene=TsM_000465100